MRKTAGCYVLGGLVLVFLTGTLSMILGMGSSFKEETNKLITETASSLAGSIYLAFLLGRLRKREWEHKKTAGEIKTCLLFGLALFLGRSFSRLVFEISDHGGKETFGYLICTAIDLLCIILLYIKMPAKEKEENTKEENTKKENTNEENPK